jgi:hypothetical protein
MIAAGRELPPEDDPLLVDVFLDRLTASHAQPKRRYPRIRVRNRIGTVVGVVCLAVGVVAVGAQNWTSSSAGPSGNTQMSPKSLGGKWGWKAKLVPPAVAQPKVPKAPELKKPISPQYP